MSHRLSLNHYTTTCCKQRVTTKELKQILLEVGDWIFAAGRKCNMKKRSLGAGVYEIWFEPEGD